MAPGRIRAVFFDVGETIVDESRLWGIWADCLGVSRLTFFALLGAVIARREHHRRVFELVKPNYDFEKARRDRERGNWPPDVLAAEDLYPDALDCLATLKTRGYLVGLAGNQPAAAEAILRDLKIPVDIVASSERWGVEKPSPAFFERIVRETSLAPSEIAYVGDRVDNDVVPARDAGMVSIFIRRGPWGAVHATWPEASHANWRIETLGELPSALERV